VSRRDHFSTIALLSGFAACLLACSSILGIEDAEPDPLFGAGGGGQSAGALCTEYCDTVMANCKEPDAVYTSHTTCLDVCEALQAGEEGDTFANTVQCRLGNARTALSEPVTECPAAGPGGDNICGTNCEGFCVLFQSACGNKFSAVYASLQKCREDCEANIPDKGGYTIDDDSGDSVQCRLWHSSVALDDPIQHCEHVAGESICVASGGAGGTGGAGGSGG